MAEGARIAQASGDPSAIVSSFVGLAFFHYTAGQLERALAYNEEGIAATDDPGLGRDRFGYAPTQSIAKMFLTLAGQEGLRPHQLGFSR